MSWQWNGRLKIAKAGLKSVLKPGFRSHHQMERWRCPEQAAGSREWQRIVLSSCVYAYISTGICLPRSRDGDAIIPCFIQHLPFKQRPRCLKGKKRSKIKKTC